MIRALARLRQRHGIAARLCVVGGNFVVGHTGDADELERLMQIARHEGVADVVEFAGSRGRSVLSRYYSACDVFVTTPWYEPFGITPIEAMACRRPVVGSDTGGIRHTVVDGKTGFRVPPRDPDALAEKLAILAHDRLLSTRMGRAGAQRAHDMFTWSRVGTDLAAIFDRLARHRTPVWRVSPEPSLRVVNQT